MVRNRVSRRAAKLLNDLKERTGARFILTSPLAQGSFSRSLLRLSEHNRELARHGDVVRDVAKEKEAAFIDPSDWYVPRRESF